MNYAPTAKQRAEAWRERAFRASRRLRDAEVEASFWAEVAVRAVPARYGVARALRELRRTAAGRETARWLRAHLVAARSSGRPM